MQFLGIFLALLFATLSLARIEPSADNVETVTSLNLDRVFATTDSFERTYAPVYSFATLVTDVTPLSTFDSEALLSELRKVNEIPKRSVYYTNRVENPEYVYKTVLSEAHFYAPTEVPKKEFEEIYGKKFPYN